jgi:polar amino acid transport system substrate-binding protein
MMKQMIGLAAGVLMTGLAVSAPAHADDLAAIKEAGEIRIASSGAYPPFSMVNEKNEVVGFDVAIGKAIAERLGVEPVITTTAWDGIIAGLLAGKYDTIIGSMSITPEREKAVDFVGPYYHAGRAIFVPEDSDIQAMEDLQGKTIGVTLGETHEKWAREQTDMEWELKTYKGLPELLLELENDRIDAMVIDSIPGRVAIKKEDRPIRELELPGLEGGEVAVGIAIRKDNPELAAAMQAALDEMMQDGTYEEIAMEWVGADIR